MVKKKKSNYNKKVMKKKGSNYNKKVIKRKVNKVNDGDTITIRHKNKDQKVRLAKNSPDGTKKDVQQKKKLEKTYKNKKANIEVQTFNKGPRKGQILKDKYGRILGKLKK